MVSLDLLPESFVWSANFMKLNKTESQPSFEELGVEVGSLVWKLPNFSELQKHLYSTASFDWGASSSEWQLAKNWRTGQLAACRGLLEASRELRLSFSIGGSLSELTSQKLGRSLRQLHLHQLQLWQLHRLQLSGSSKPSLHKRTCRRRFPM